MNIGEAIDFVGNSGVLNWEWGEAASAAGFAAWIAANCRTIDRNDYDSELRAYLRSVGESSADYGL